MRSFFLLALIAIQPGTALAANRAAAFAVQPSQKLVELLGNQEAYANPSRHATRLGPVVSARPLTGERTVLPLLGKWVGPGGITWLHVRLPGRPNSHAGWIVRHGTRLTRTPWHVVVSTEARTVTVYDHGRRQAVFAAVVGASSTPTPDGQFFVEEVLALDPGTMGGPYALALSARSNVYSEFDGGPGQIALHSTYAIGGTLGTAESNGCVRLDPNVTSWLAARIGPGVPVSIVS